MTKNEFWIKNTKLFSILSIICSVIGCLFFIPNLVFHVPSGLILLSIPFGVLAVIFGLLTFLSGVRFYRVLLVVIGSLVTCGFFLLMGVFSVLEAIGM